jgi:hypothetical protein
LNGGFVCLLAETNWQGRKKQSEQKHISSASRRLAAFVYATIFRTDFIRKRDTGDGRYRVYP